MAETVLSMARSMLGGAVKMAASAAADEMSLLMGVQKDIWFIKDELETMQAFLVTAEAMMKKDMLLKVWAKQVRDLSYNIEDCLGEFMVHMGSQSLSRRLMKLKDRHRIAMQIRNLKSRVEEVSNRNTRYNLIDKNQATSKIDERDSCMEDIRHQSGSNIDEAELVGFTKPKQELIKLIDVPAMSGPAQVVCVVGMGGLGKTTLTRKVYESIENFSCCAWITVSQSFVRMELLKVMIKEFFGVEALKEQLKGKVAREENLASYLRNELKEKRYFVVLDDLWNKDDWKWIKMIAFPNGNNKGSRIMVTTRDVSLAKDCSFESSEPLIYPHEPLQTQDAMNLLLRKTRKTQKDMENDENMRNIVTKIVKKSGCLPLAILTIGGMLAAKRVTEWENIYKQIPSVLETNHSFDAMRRMVTLSYNHLPSHLKSCFLYLSIFPEDFEIKRRRLVERWMAEGFVRAKGGMNIEDVGISYFNELINRSMIQPSKVNIEGSVKSCKVHDIMRDVMISISRDENFVYLTGDNVTSVEQENFCHVAYHGSKCQKIEMDWSHVRSVTMFGERPMESLPSVFSPVLRMLRTLDLEDVDFEIKQKDINNIGLLRHLKYVNINHRNAYYYKLPRSIGKLQGLQILDMRKYFISSLPNEISKLQSLRSLRCSLVRVPRGIGKLKKLQILEVVDFKRTDDRAIEELGELRQLRKLKLRKLLCGAKEQKYKILCAAIEKLPSLSSLYVGGTKGLAGIDPGTLEWLRSIYVDGTDNNMVGTLEWMHSISSPPPLLRSLKLRGCLEEMPDWVGSLMHLVKIHLWGSRLKEGKSMEILGALPNLMILHLRDEAYVGEKLVFRVGAFLNLRILEIWSLEQLREVGFEKDTSPLMERIEIGFCRLESGIIGIKHLPRLKEISLGNFGKVGKLGVLQGELDSHPNHPLLRLEKGWRQYDLGDVVEGSNDVQEEASAGESSQPQVAVPATSDSGDHHLLYTYNSC